MSIKYPFLKYLDNKSTQNKHYSQFYIIKKNQDYYGS